MYEGNIMDYFPLKKARAGQTAVIAEIDKVFKSGKKFVILEGPVGCGKSAIGMTFAKAFGTSHLITPRKSLQNQYFEDFEKDVVLMKGRNAYPCTRGLKQSTYIKVIKDIENGQIRQPGYDEPNCGTAPCRENRAVYDSCVATQGECPYNVAMQTAQQHPTVIHNIHSFIFQTSFAMKFSPRDLLVIDEAHDIEGILREFISRKFTLNKVIKPEDRPKGNNVHEWCAFFLNPEFVPKVTAQEHAMRAKDPEYVTARDEYIEKVQSLRAQETYYKDKFIVKSTINKVGNREMSTTFEFVPDSLGNAAQNFLFELGEYVILMSGTIYGKDTFCKNLGINPETAHYIRIPSTFPKENRPIILKPEYQVDTSYATWDENFNEMIEKIEKIMNIFDDAKGLIHAPSYDAAEQIALAIGGPRIMTHGKNDAQDKLQMFFESKEPLVFISPVCQQGVDFKGDRARFQIILRVPYLNTSDEFINHKVKNDFPWYNHQALVTFGQQLGRINRSEDDYGATFLMDARFGKFLSRNLSKIPKWVQHAFVWK